MRTLLVALALYLVPTLAAGAPKFSREQIKYFENHVRPLLIQRCSKCHGEKKQNGKLRVDSRAAIVGGGESGPAIVPGKPSESLLVEAIKWESLEMPPKGKLPAKEIAILERWVKMGAPWPKETKAVVAAGPKITAEDRKWWAFQPIRDPKPPAVKDPSGWVRNNIDRFFLHKGAKPTVADKRVLIRRVTFGLTGLPPTPAEVDAYLQDNRPGAWQRLIDRLLKSRRYGERWARHWLDLVRYADTDGFRQDALRPNAWRYRDYVVNSFNNDKPYDRFIKEQLAGDELYPGDREALIATGFLRHGVFEFNQRDARQQWSDTLNEVTDVTGDVFLAMGMGCAKCHDHKFDPILQKDYYRLRAYFAALEMRDETEIASEQQRSAFEKQQAKWLAETRSIRERLAEIEKPAKAKAAEDAIVRFPDDVEAMARKPHAKRSPLEKQLADLVMRQVVLEYEGAKLKKLISKKLQPEWEKLRKELAKFDSLKPKPLPTARAAGDVARSASPTFIEGKERLGAIAPGVLTILDERDAVIPPLPSDVESTGRRAALAKWIATPANPLTARVMVNRIWQHHFGTGLVETPSDFGRLGTKPSHPELLDWLASRFIESGWSIKAMHRLILNSAAYRQTRRARRLDADQIRDAVLFATDELDTKSGGKSVSTKTTRRTIYTTLERNKTDDLLDVFDFNVGTDSVPQRNVTITPTQSLLMFNGKWMLARAAALAKRVEREAPNNPEAQIRLLHQLLYSREPSTHDLSLAREFLKQSAAQKPKPIRPRTARLNVIDAIDLKPSAVPLRLVKPEQLGKTFRIEAVVLLRSLYADATVRTIVSAWDSRTANQGWSLGVTSTRSAFKPRNLILQFVGKDAEGKTKYEVVASDLRLELNKPYRVTVIVSLADRSKNGVVFELQDLSSKSKPLVAKVSHKVVQIPSAPAMVLGGRINSTRHRWDGLIGKLKIQRGKDLFGEWDFNGEQPLVDASSNGRNFQFGPQPASKNAALVDYCHVLLNTNEFLFVE